MPFHGINGHRRSVGLLSRSIVGEALPPSLLFSGPQGVGKRLTAVATAQALNCNAEKGSYPFFEASGEKGVRPLFDACGACAACSRIARNVHPDVLVIEPGDSGSIKIEQVRDLIDRAAYRPFEGRRRV